MKTFVLIVSRYFPATHKRKGLPTLFVERFFNGQNKIVPCEHCLHYAMCNGSCIIPSLINYPKIHTIRSNYPLWKKRISQIQKGEAILSVRYWSGKPYNSKQVEFSQLNKDSGISVQKLEFYEDDIYCPYVYEENGIANKGIDCVEEIAKNDGLPFTDFKEWFKKYDLSEPMAIIHFTKFRY